MNRILYFIAGLIVTIALVHPALSEEKKPEHFWYRLEIQTGDTTYQCIGSSLLAEKDFAQKIAGTEPVQLDDATYVDAGGKVKNWQDWDPKASSRVYVNPRYVILFNPLKGDPKKTAGSKSE
jgi:hypothetical protein